MDILVQSSYKNSAQKLFFIAKSYFYQLFWGDGVHPFHQFGMFFREENPKA